MKTAPPTSLTVAQNWSPNGSGLPASLFLESTVINIASSNNKKHYTLTWTSGSQAYAMTLKWHGHKEELHGKSVTITGPSSPLPAPLEVVISLDSANDDWDGTLVNPNASVHDGTANTGTFVADATTGPIPPSTPEE